MSKYKDIVSIKGKLTPNKKKRIKKYAGSVKGYSDLASNPKHMENYGKSH